jgi:hypothetical protein
MTSSTFYHDGYRDAMDYLPYSPPDLTVHEDEYRKGYTSGRYDRLLRHADSHCHNQYLLPRA